MTQSGKIAVVFSNVVHAYLTVLSLILDQVRMLQHFASLLERLASVRAAGADPFMHAQTSFASYANV